MISVLTFDNFLNFQKSKDVSPYSTYDSRKIDNRKININYKSLNYLLIMLEKLKEMNKNTPELMERLTNVIESLKGFMNITPYDTRYLKTEYCVRQDRLFLLEQLGLMNTSEDYQIVYSTEGLLAEILAMGWGLNVEILRNKIEKSLEDSRFGYDEFSKKILGHKFELIDIQNLYNIDPSIESSIVDLNYKVQNMSLKFHSEKWNDYKITDYGEVLNKAFSIMIWDLQQYLINQMIINLDMFRKELDSSVKTSITSYTHGSFVLQCNKKIDFPVFEVIDRRGLIVCIIEPKIYAKSDCLKNCLAINEIK